MVTPRQRVPRVIKSKTPRVKKPRKPKSQVRKNKSAGTGFENRMFQYFNEYMKDKGMQGIAYKLPDGRNCDQIVDILIDSPDLGFCAVECKQINDSCLIKEKIYLKKLSRKSAEYGHQFKKQHVFMRASGRFGLLAVHFSSMGVTILVPHQFVYERIESGTVYITVTELLKNSYCVNDGRGSLKLFIHNKCRVYDRDE